MKTVLTTLLAICLCLPLMGADKGKRLPEDIKSLELLAEKGNERAQSELGRRLFREDLKKEAAKWLHKAAEQGDIRAQSGLGLLYGAGNGVPLNTEESAKWYRKAAEQGDASSQYSIGSYYEDGIGVPKNYVIAFAWYSLALANGVELAIQSRKTLAKKMTDKQLVEGNRLPLKMIKDNPKVFKILRDK